MDTSVIVFKTGATIGAALVLLCAAPLLIAEALPASSAGRATAGFLPVGSVHAILAEAALARGDWRGAEQESRAELAISPVLQDAWLRLARVDVMRHGELTDAGVEALVHGYDAEPYDLSRRGVRRCFVRVHMAEATKTLVEAADAERRALADISPLGC